MANLVFHAAMNPEDIEALHRATKRKKDSVAPTPKHGQIEAILAKPVVGGFSGLKSALRKESSVLVKAIVPLQSVALRDVAPRPSTSLS